MRDRSRGLTAVIVTFNSVEVLPACLAALDAAMEGVPDWQVVVVDNASSDGSLQLAAEQRPDVVALQTGHNGGYAYAINHAVREAPVEGDLLVLNPDVTLAPGSVRVLLDALDRTRAGIVAPRLLGPDGAIRPSLRREYTVLRAAGEAVVGGRRSGRRARWGHVVGDPAAYEREGWVDWATGAVLLISAACREAVGEWDESFFLYSEETDYCLRARDLGFGVRFVPSASATHLEGGGESNPALRPYLVASKTRLYRRRNGPISSATFRLVSALNEAVRIPTGRPEHRAGLRTALGRRPARPAQPPQPPGLAGPSQVADSSGPVESVEPRESGGAVVFFSAQDYWYHNRAHSDIQLARNMARSRPVLLVNSIGMRMPTPGKSTQTGRRLLRKLASTARAIRRPDSKVPDLYVMSPLILPLYGNPQARRLNATLVRFQVRIALRYMHIRSLPDVVVTIPTAWDVVRSMPRRSLVINRSDKYSAFPETDQQLIADMERQLLGHADAAMYVSHHLLDEERQMTAGRSVFLGHGVDYDYFASADSGGLPDDLARVPGPRVGFFGGIDDYVVDLDLIRRLAVELPDVSVVLIGAATCPMDDLTALPNLHWLGARTYDQIAGYGAGFDVAIMPWLTNDWIAHCNPIKAKEYLALGLPTVTMRYAEARALDAVMDIADTPEEFIALVRKAVDGGGRATAEARRQAVEGDSWQARAHDVLALLDTRGGS